jgi:hypothetical protein
LLMYSIIRSLDRMRTSFALSATSQFVSLSA